MAGEGPPPTTCGAGLNKVVDGGPSPALTRGSIARVSGSDAWYYKGNYPVDIPIARSGVVSDRLADEPVKIEVTDEMVAAAEILLLSFDRERDVAADSLRDIYYAMEAAKALGGRCGQFS
jgi:hypothetical protein